MCTAIETNDTVRFVLVKKGSRIKYEQRCKVKPNKEDFQRDELEVILQHIQFYFLFPFS